MRSVLRWILQRLKLRSVLPQLQISIHSGRTLEEMVESVRRWRKGKGRERTGANAFSSSDDKNMFPC